MGGETEALGFSPESTAVKADSHEPECSGGKPPVTSEEANRAGGFQQNGTKLPDRPPASCHPLNPCGQRGADGTVLALSSGNIGQPGQGLGDLLGPTTLLVPSPAGDSSTREDGHAPEEEE